MTITPPVTPDHRGVRDVTAALIGRSRHHTPTSEPDPQTDVYAMPDWEQRLRDAVAATLAAKAARKAEREQMKARRDAGLVQRYAAKQARTNPRGSRGHSRGRGATGEPMPEVPPCCARLAEPCPQHRQQGQEIRHQGPRNRSAVATRVIGESGKARPAKPPRGDEAR